MKKIIPIVLSLSLIIPVLSSAQTTAPIIPNLPDIGQTLSQSIPAPVSGFIDQLKNVLQSGAKSISSGQSSLGGNGMSLSSVGNLWDQLNNWFSSNIGVSFADIVKAIMNFIIWIWELIIKLIQTGLSHL